MARSRLADQVGRVVGGRYRLLAPVGTGASADVYVADDVTLRRRVAVKVLHDALATDDGFLRRFRAEARVVASLRHPNIMSVFDWGEDEDGAYLVLEYLGGGSLRDLFDRGQQLSLSQATMVGLEAARGLEYAHRRGLIHRDIKPANLLFDDEGRLAIADFGIARALAEATWTEPAGAMVGTVRYASPEQARGNSLDGRADVYALALVIVETITGSVPFAADTTIATLMARLDRAIPPPEGPLRPVVEAAGTVEPSDRLDAVGLVKALEAVASRLPKPEPLPLLPLEHFPLPGADGDAPTTLAAPIPVGTPASPDAPPPPSEPKPPTAKDPAGKEPTGKEPTRSKWRYPWVALAAIVAAVVVAVAVFAVPGLTPKTYLVPTLTGHTITEVKGTHYPHFTIREIDVRRGPPKGVVLDQDPKPPRKVHGGVITVWVSIGYPTTNVPDLTGDTLDQARVALQNVGLVLNDTVNHAFSDSIAVNHIVSWDPHDGTVEQHTPITVTVSDGPELVTMPDVTNQPVAQATAALQAAGIALPPNTTQAFSDTVPNGSVISTTPPPGAQADRAKAVTLVVSKGPDIVTVPDVTGQSVTAAEAALRAAGLKPGGPYGPPGGNVVVLTSPTAGRKVKRGSTVYIFSSYG